MIGIIVFQLIEWIAITAKSRKSVLRCFDHLQAYDYKATPTRHEVCIKPCPQEVYTIC